MTDTNFPQLHQFLTCPHSSGRVVGIAQYQHLDARIGCLALQIFIVHMIGVVCINQRIAHYFTSVVAHGREKAVIDRSLKNHLVAGFCHRLDDGGNGRNHP